MNRISGYATRAGTEHYKTDHQRSDDHFSTGLDLFFSTVGLGTYLGNPTAEDDDLYYGAIKTAVKNGCNVIDTALNYRGMRSERVIAKALRDLVEEKTVTRDQIIISTKVGFIPVDIDRGSSYMNEYFLKKNIIDNDDIQFMHSLKPEFIRECVDLSLENLGLETIDILFIHNPEVQLERVEKDKFYDQLSLVFQCLEDLVDKGVIRMYGTATWSGYRVDHERKEFLSLENVLRAAQNTSAGANHHFQVIQLPVSLSMPEAFTTKNQHFQGRRYTFVELARMLNLIIISSRTIDKGQTLDRISLDLPVIQRIQMIRSLSGITSGLVGMRNPLHVKENLSILHIDKMSSQRVEEIMKRLS